MYSPCKKTNQEVLNWLKLNEEKSQQAILVEANVFFGSFPGGKTKLNKDMAKLKDEDKRRKRKAHKNLMKDCGGGGKEGNIPPDEYVPQSFAIGEICPICKQDFNSNEELRKHSRITHEDHVKKCWSSDAMANVALYSEYGTWLESSYDTSTINQLEQERAQLEKQNKVLRERNENLAQTQETYVKVAQKGCIIETKRETIKPNKDGTIRRSVLTEQFVNVTKRNHDDKENETPNQPKKRNRQQIQGINDILEHMSSGNMEVKASILSSVIDAQGAEIAKIVTKDSKEIQLTNKLSKEQTAALISGSNLSDYQLRQLRTACNKELGNNPFASEREVTKARNEMLPISREDWETTYPDLYRNKIGKNADKKKRTCVLNVTNLKTYIEKVANIEKNNLVSLVDGDELHVCWDGDGGGGRFVAEFTLLNNDDKKVTLHPFLIYEGSDVRDNLEVTLGRLSKQIKDLEGETINVDGKLLKLKQFGVFDLCALNTILGKQNHSSTYFDAWTDCTLKHIRNHSGRKHTTSSCKDIKFLTLAQIEKYLTHHSLKNMPQRKTGNLFGNVIGENLLPLDNIFRYIPPLMHIIMGLGNDVLNELKRVVIELDEKEAETQNIHENIERHLKILYEEKESLETRHANNALDKVTAENDLERLCHISDNKIKKASDVAKRIYKKVKSKAKKANCNSELCVIFPCDEENGSADIIVCHNGCKVHKRCEGIVYEPENYMEPDMYICKKCIQGVVGKSWLEESIKDGIKLASNENRDIMRRLTEIKIEIEKVKNEDSKCGDRQKQLKNSMKALKINPAIYHGGDLEGKAVQNLLDCARDQSFTILQCLSDKTELYGKFQRALTTLHEVSDIFKSKIEFFSEDEIAVVKSLCENWGKNWPVDFPHLNLTPEGHDLVWVLPEILRHTQSFYMFYKVEEKGESIHAELNSIQRKIWCIRDPAERLWKYIERYELKNSLDTNIVVANKK